MAALYQNSLPDVYTEKVKIPISVVLCKLSVAYVPTCLIFCCSVLFFSDV